MKKPSDDLFRIIHSMKPSEKRYYKMHFASEGSVLTDLFDYLNAQDAYDEQSVKQFFREKGAPNFKVYKNQLRQQVLKSLTSFHHKRGVMSKIRQGLEEVEVLAEKQLYDLAIHQLEKIRQICEQYEEYTYLIEIARLDYFLGHIARDKPGLGTHPAYETIEKSLRHLRRQTKLSHLSNELIDSARKAEQEGLSEAGVRELQNLLQFPLLQDSPSASTVEKLSRNIAKSRIYELLGEDAKGSQMRRENVQLFRREAYLKESMPIQYLGVLRNYLNDCLRQEDYEEVAQLLEEGKSFAERYTRVQHHLSYFLYVELEMYFRQCRFEQLLKQAPKVIRHLKHNQIAGERIAFLIYGIVFIAHLATRRHKEAATYLRMIQDSREEVRQIFTGLPFIFEWISFFDAGEDYLADHLLQSFRRRSRKKISDPFLQSLLCFFRKLLAEPSNRRQLTRQFIDSLDQFEEKGVLLGFRHFRLEDWLRALSRGQTIAEACGDGG